MEMEESVAEPYLSRLGIGGRGEAETGNWIGKRVAVCIIEEALRTGNVDALREVSRRCTEEEEEDDEGGDCGEGRGGEQHRLISPSSKRKKLMMPHSRGGTCRGSASSFLKHVAAAVRALSVTDARGDALWLAYFEGLASALPRAIGARATANELCAVLGGCARSSRALLTSATVVTGMIRAVRGADALAETTVALFIGGRRPISSSIVHLLLATLDSVDGKSHAVERVICRRAVEALDDLNRSTLEKCLVLLSAVGLTAAADSPDGIDAAAAGASTRHAQCSYEENLSRILSSTCHATTGTSTSTRAEGNLSPEATRFVINVFTAMVPHDSAAVLKANMTAVRRIAASTMTGTGTGNGNGNGGGRHAAHHADVDIMAKEYKILALSRLRDFSHGENATRGAARAQIGAHAQHALVAKMAREPSRSTLEDVENLRREFATQGNTVTSMLVNVITMWRREWWAEEAMPALAWPPTSGSATKTKTKGENANDAATHIAMVEALVARQFCSPLVLEKLRQRVKDEGDTTTAAHSGDELRADSLARRCRALLAELRSGSGDGVSGSVGHGRALVSLPPASRVEMLVHEVASGIRARYGGFGPRVRGSAKSCTTVGAGADIDDSTSNGERDDIVEILMEVVSILVRRYAPVTKLSHDAGAGSAALGWCHTILAAICGREVLAALLLRKLEAAFRPARTSYTGRGAGTSEREDAQRERSTGRVLLPSEVSSFAAVAVAMQVAHVAAREPMRVRACFAWNRGDGSARGPRHVTSVLDDVLLPSSSSSRGICDAYELAMTIEAIARFLTIARKAYRDRVHVFESSAVAPDGAAAAAAAADDDNCLSADDDALILLENARSGGIIAVVISATLLRFVAWARQRLEARLDVWVAFHAHAADTKSDRAEEGDAAATTACSGDTSESILRMCHRTCVAISSMPCMRVNELESSADVRVVFRELVRFELAVARNPYMSSRSAVRDSTFRALTRCAAATATMSPHTAVDARAGHARVATAAVSSLVDSVLKFCACAGDGAGRRGGALRPLTGSCVSSFNVVNAMLLGVYSFFALSLPPSNDPEDAPTRDAVVEWTRDTCRAIDEMLSMQATDSTSAVAAFVFAVATATTARGTGDVNIGAAWAEVADSLSSHGFRDDGESSDKNPSPALLQQLLFPRSHMVL